MGGARHSARRPTLTVDPKLRQTIIETERLLKDDEPSSHAPYWATTYNSNITRTIILSFLNVWTRDPKQFWPRLRDTSTRAI